MTDEWLDDDVLVVVRAARPAGFAVEEAPSSPEAQALLGRVLSSHPSVGPRRYRRWVRRWSDWAIPAIGGLTAVAVAIVALVALGHSHRAPAGAGTGHSAPAGAGTGRPGRRLSASQYVFAVGGDGRSNASPVGSGVVLLRAEQVLRARCMQQRGFYYVPAATPTVSALPSVTGYPSTFYPEPVASAYPEQTLLAVRQHEGFGIHTNTLQQGHDPDANDRYVKTLPPDRQKLWIQAASGRDGCYGTTDAQIFGSRRAANMESSVPVRIYNYLDSVVYNPNGSISPSSPRTAAAVAAWSRCIKKATGTAWSDENAVVATLSEHSSGHMRPEITLAVADTKCAYSTGQAQTFAAAFRQAANHLPPQIQTNLRYLLAHRAGWIHQANKLLASARP